MLLQAIADLLATATSETEYNVLRFWKDTISQFQFLYDIQQRNVSDHSNVILALIGRRMASGETFSLTLPIGPASRTQTGVMTAEESILLLESLGKKGSGTGDAGKNVWIKRRCWLITKTIIFSFNA